MAYRILYIEYDMNKPFLPQFIANLSRLKGSLKLMKNGVYEDLLDCFKLCEK